MSDRLRSAAVCNDGGYEDVYETEIGGRPPSAAVVQAVGAMTDREPTSLDPLYETIDPDALDALCTNSDAADPSVTFQYHGFSVTVEGTDRVVVVEP